MKVDHLMMGLTTAALLWSCGPALENEVQPAEVGPVETQQALTGYDTLKNAYTGLCLGGDATKPVAQACQPTWTSQRFQLITVPGTSFKQIKHLYSGLCLGDNRTNLEWEPCSNTGWFSEHWLLFADNGVGQLVWNRYSTMTLGSWPTEPLRREVPNATYWSQRWKVTHH